MQVNQPWYQFPTDHLEQFSRSAAALTIDPYKNTIYYFFPFISAYFNNYQELRANDAGLEAMMPQDTTRRVLGEIQILTDCAGIQRQIAPHIALNFQFASCGGSYSLSKPALFMPGSQILRHQGISPFPQEQPGENLRGNKWYFSDDQVRFLICRELGQLKENNILLRIAIKVSIIAAIFIFYALPLSWPIGLTLFISAIGLYIVSERLFQTRADLIGADVLGKRIGDRKRAYQVAIETLEKQRQQNLYRRENSKLARVYLTSSGNNVLDFIHPYLTTRVGRLQECERKL